MRRWIVRAIIFVLSLPLVGLTTWYAVSFVPHISEISAMANSGLRASQDVEAFKSYAIAAETEKGIRVWAIRKAYWSLVRRKNRSSTASWHANNMLWYWASFMHFDNNEVFGLWVSCAIKNCDSGLPGTALEYYGKKLQDLSKRELMGLVAMVRSTSVFKPGSSYSEKRIEYILNEVKANNR